MRSFVAGAPSLVIGKTLDALINNKILWQLDSHVHVLHFNICLGAKEQLMKDNEELKKQREELEVRLSALKSQYEGRLSRQERELRDLRGQQERQEQRDEQPEAGPSKVRVW